MENLSKMEGHVSLDVKIREGKVIDTKLKVSENKRFYTQAIRGEYALNIPNLVSRICGTCSTAHLLAATACVENALSIEVSEQTKSLRELAQIATILRDHAMHLYLFCLPDIFNRESIFEFEGDEEKVIEKAFKIRKVASELSNVVLGRTIHGIYSAVGGFVKIPEREKLNEIKNKLLGVREDVLDTLDLFSVDWSLGTKSNYICLINDDFDFTDGLIKCSDGTYIQKDEFANYLHRVILPYSQASSFKLLGKTYRVGALARLNLNKGALAKFTKDIKSYLKKFPSENIFDNILAQAIEMLFCVDKAVHIISNIELRNEEPIKASKKSGIGIGVVEAPRGTLYYELKISNGYVKDGLIIIPTAQNLIKMEQDIAAIVEKNIESERHAIEHEIEKLIRAYDPCFSCSTHFLKVNWI
jgi:coenzyme F420-reducing hydrogenase alpha subunit